MSNLFHARLIGYSRKDVNAYISRLNEEFSQKLLEKELEKKEELRALQEENERLKKENEEKRKQEKQENDNYRMQKRPEKRNQNNMWIICLLLLVICQ